MSIPQINHRKLALWYLFGPIPHCSSFKNLHFGVDMVAMATKVIDLVSKQLIFDEKTIIHSLNA